MGGSILANKIVCSFLSKFLSGLLLMMSVFGLSIPHGNHTKIKKTLRIIFVRTSENVPVCIVRIFQKI